ncbi:hypothetical protein CLU92_5360 [Janthinobacterium sp. 61]|uniref:hypothetical protein n=1 Tax=Janthinobacterium sp. 61 TaxID=2035209 RepID=UPI000C709DE3|nr:hypothetical protein [Janthinobacterium sp. 61]PKV47887.1 hypothetical protein CLU92_5360 [Janthinobacterium sp. 61]
MKWFSRILKLIRKILSMSDHSFIPRDKVTQLIDIRQVVAGYVIKTSDGTKIAIAIKINNIWYSIAFDASLDAELSKALGYSYSEVYIDEWAQLIFEYGTILELLDKKVMESKPKVGNKFNPAKK